MHTTMLNALNLIDGEWQPSGAAQGGESLDPANGKRIGWFADSRLAEGQQAIAAARRAFNGRDWAHNPRLRQSLMLQWADRLERCDGLANLLTRENGKVLAQSQREIAAAISEIRYYAGLARHISGHALEAEPGVCATVLRQPAGVVGLIIPWNAPVVLLIRSLAPVMAAGCTAVIKPAPQTAQISAAIIRELHAVPGIPRGVVNLVSEVGHDVAKALVASADVDVISFTGSNETGRKIVLGAAASMKKLSLELSGKSCCLVFPDVDIEQIAPQLAVAATIISGQQCTAARRILVHASRYNEMKAALKRALAAIVVGPGAVQGSGMGPLIDAPTMLAVGIRTEQAVEVCDEVILRGSRLGGALAKGYFLSPTLVAHDDCNVFFCQEEIFGPFIVLEKFVDEQEAVAKANNSVFGLSASVWTRDGSRALRVARALRNGTVWVNDHNRLAAEAETGGYRRSGLGRLHGYDGLLDFLKTRHIYRPSGMVA